MTWQEACAVAFTGKVAALRLGDCLIEMYAGWDDVLRTFGDDSVAITRDMVNSACWQLSDKSRDDVAKDTDSPHRWRSADGWKTWKQRRMG